MGPPKRGRKDGKYNLMKNILFIYCLFTYLLMFIFKIVEDQKKEKKKMILMMNSMVMIMKVMVYLMLQKKMLKN